MIIKDTNQLNLATHYELQMLSPTGTSVPIYSGSFALVNAARDKMLERNPDLFKAYNFRVVEITIQEMWVSVSDGIY